MEIEIQGPLQKSKKLKPPVAKPLFQILVFFKENDQDFRLKWDGGKSYFYFVYKRKPGVERRVREEVTVKIAKRELKSFLLILKSLGFKKGFVSPVERIDVIDNKGIIWSFKLGSVIGDYWEAEASEKLIQTLKDEKQVIAFLLKSARSQGLSVWSDLEFKKIKELKWAGIKPQSLAGIYKILKAC